MKKVLFLILALLLTLTFVYAQEVNFYGYSEIGVHSEFLKDSNGNYSNTLGPVNLDYWNTYFKIKAEPSSLLEGYFELHLYPNYSNLFGPGIIEVQKAHLIAKSSVMNLRVYYKEDATPFDDPLLLNNPGDLPGSSWIWGNGIEISGKAFDTNFLAGINSSDQISYVRLKRAFPPLMVGFTAMGSNWGQANVGKSLFGVDVTGKVANVDIKAEGIYGKCVWGPNPTDSEGGMVLYGDFSTQLTPVIKLYGIGKKEPEKVSPGIPIMVDESGKVMHIYPHRDSVLTSITLETKNVLIVSAGVPGVEKDLVFYAAKLTAELLVKYANGKWDGMVKLG